jgi:hypothetical protein
LPGPGDAPVDHCLREAYNVEVVFPFLRDVHGTMAFAPGHVEGRYAVVDLHRRDVAFEELATAAA